MTIWEKINKDFDSAAEWMTRAIYEFHCKMYQLQWMVDHLGEEYKGCPPYVQSVREKHDQNWKIFFEICAVVFTLVVGALVMWYLFPAIEIFSDIVGWLYDLSTYIYYAFGILWGMWMWVDGLVVDFLTVRMAPTLGGSPFLWWLLGTEIMIMSLAYALLGILGVYHDLRGSVLETVFTTLNYPFKWIRESILQRYFGKFLGNLISIVEIPLESLAFAVSLPISCVIWLAQTLTDGKNK